MQYSKNPKTFHAMSIKPMNKNKVNVGRREEDKLIEEYLDRYEGVQSEILNMTRFDENSDLSTTYLARSSMIRDHKMVAEERFPMSEQGYTTDNY